MFGRRKIEYKTDEQLRGMVRAGVVTSRALDAAVAAARPGATTADVDVAFREVLAANGATSNFLGYFGYPATVCVSVNEEVVHGIPGERVLETGDILSIDGGAIVDGWNGDSARTVILGNPSEEDQLLSDVTREAMWRGIAAAATGTRVGDIGAAIEDHVRERVGQRLGILEDYVGHGIGSQMHMAPDVLNYSVRRKGPRLRPGMVLAIEPMLTAGSARVRELDDGWTVVTQDGSRAAQWEHTVAIVPGGVWVLTAPDGGVEGLAPFGIEPRPVR